MPARTPMVATAGEPSVESSAAEAATAAGAATAPAVESVQGLPDGRDGRDNETRGGGGAAAAGPSDRCMTSTAQVITRDAFAIQVGRLFSPRAREEAMCLLAANGNGAKESALRRLQGDRAGLFRIPVI